MSTLVKFYIDTDGNILAVFPQLNYNKTLYGNSMKTGYAHIGQHTRVSKEYYQELKPAVCREYMFLQKELQGLGYDLKVLN